MTKFTHAHYDGKHWIKGSAEYALDNELNRLNKQVMKFAKAGAQNSPYYKQLVTEIATLTHNQIKWVNGIPQAKRGNKEIAKAAQLNGDKQFRKIAKSKSHATFERFKMASKKLGLTPNELSYINNQSALYYEAMYADEDEGEPLEMYDDSESYENPFKNNLSNPHTFDNNVRDIYPEDIITEAGTGWQNVETGEYFDNYADALTSYDETVSKIQSGEWSYTGGHWGDNIEWQYYNQFKHRKDW